MKKSLSLRQAAVAAGAALIAASAPNAMAQSSVTISGILDSGLQRTRTFDGQYTNRVANGFKSSRLRFGGTEDLGGGLRANFLLEEGLNVDSGTVSSFGAFHRASWVGLSSTTLGTVRFGKALVPTSRVVCAAADLHDCGGGFNNTGLFYNGTNNFGRWVSVKPGRGGNANESMSAFSGGGAGLPNSADSGRIANAVFYETPVFAGVQGAFAYALGETAAGVANGRGNHISGGLNYRTGGLNVGAYYEHTDPDPLWNARGQMWTFGGVYGFGAARIGAVYQREGASGPRALWTQASAWAITGAYRFGSFEPYFKIGAHRTNGTGSYGIVRGRDTEMVEIGTTYDFSKRTVAYVELATDLRGSNGAGLRRKDPQQIQAGLTLYF
jgi:GBP family porin